MGAGLLPDVERANSPCLIPRQQPWGIGDMELPWSEPQIGPGLPLGALSGGNALPCVPFLSLLRATRQEGLDLGDWDYRSTMDLDNGNLAIPDQPKAERPADPQSFGGLRDAEGQPQGALLIPCAGKRGNAHGSLQVNDLVHLALRSLKITRRRLQHGVRLPIVLTVRIKIRMRV